MCFFIELKPVLEKDTSAARASLKIPEDRKKARVVGESPSFQVTDGHCSCDLVKPKGKRGKAARFDPAVIDIVREFLAQGCVKRLELIWYGGGRPEGAEKEVKLTLSEFLAANETSDLKENTVYRVTDAARFTRGTGVEPK